MKKLLSTLALSAAIATTSQATMFIGMDVIPLATGTKVYEGSTTRDPEVNRDFGYTIKLGSGHLGKGMQEIYYMYAGDYVEYGYDYVASWEATNNLFIGLKLGLNYGANNYSSYTDYYGNTYGSATDYNYGVKIGLAASYLIADLFEVKGGIDYRKLWGVDTASTYSVGVTSFYFGASFWLGSATGARKKSSSNSTPAPRDYDDNGVDSSQKYNSHDQQYNGSSDNAEDVVY